MLPATVLLVWQGAASVHAGIGVLPAPTQILRALYDAAAEGRLVADGSHTLMAALASWLICLWVGIPFGMALGSSARLRIALLPLVELLRPLPAVALIPLAVLAFGFSWKTEVAVTVFASLWPVVFASKAGIERLNPRVFEVAATLNLGRWKTLRSVIAPAAFRQILVGAKLSFGLCLVVSVVAEMVGNPAGLGWGLVSAQEAMRGSETFAYLLTIGVLGVAANAALDRVVRLMAPGMDLGQ
jgi:NitT/TauT family transport system permease protein